jgi:hypothetical protein
MVKRPFRSRKSTSTTISHASSAASLEAQSEPLNRASIPVEPHEIIPAPVVPDVTALRNDRAQVLPPAAKLKSPVPNQAAAAPTPLGNIAAIASPDGLNDSAQADHFPSQHLFPSPTQPAVIPGSPANPAAVAPPADALLRPDQVANVIPNQTAAAFTSPSKATVALQSKKATKWNEALKTFEQTNPELFKELEGKVNALIQRNIGQKIAFCDLTIPDSIADKPQSHEAVQRMKRWLPSLAAVKTVVMPIAALDPHKIAPICCGLVFGIAEVRILRLVFLALLTRGVCVEHSKP